MEENGNTRINRIILIGNGFDLAHGLKTSYKDFITAFWREELRKTNNYTYLKTSAIDSGKSYYIFEDDFIKVKLENIVINEGVIDEQKYGKVINETEQEIKKIEDGIARLKGKIEEYKNGFLELIEKAINVNNWVDIEELYYKQLVRCTKQELDAPNDVELSSPIKKLNKDFEAIRCELEKYLSSIDPPERNGKIAYHLQKEGNPKEVLFLNFNYTDTEKLYIKESYVKKDDGKKYMVTNTDIPAKIIHIHGELNNKKNPMIFGYGDELAKNFTEIENLNNNFFFENAKSVKYSETNNYGELEEFIQKGDYEIFIFGHSCGNSDRTLLNFLFEKGIEGKGKCTSIKIFYHQREDGSDDYSEKTQNIFRNFTEKSTYRKLVKDKDKNHKALISLDKSPDPIMDNMVKIEFDENTTAYKNIDDKIASKKKLKESFYISKYLVNQELYSEIMKKNPSHFQGDNRQQCPVENVSWYDAVEFCNKLSEKYNLEKYYNIVEKDVTFNVGANGFRLPVETEWEYAARGGIEGKDNQYAGCNTDEELKYYAWYGINSDNKTHPVGQWKSNELGLCDMSGNVWEWCEDLRSGGARYRVLRGGSWNYGAKDCRVWYWFSDGPGNRDYNIGFRLARSL